MDTFEVLIAVGLLIALVGIVVLLLKKPTKTDSDAGKFLQNDLANLRRDLNALSENLRETFDEKLDKTQTSMTAQLHNSSKIVAEISTRLTKLDETNKRVVDVAEELKTIQNVLTNAKQRGGLGEYYLENVLGNVLPPGVWDKQYHFKNGDAVDAVVFLKDKKILPIDSKFSLENYNRMIEAPNKTEREKLNAELKRDLKNRIDETAKYIRPTENTMDFAFMFIPSEALYYDAIVNDVGQGGSSRNLIDYAFNDKKVIIVSPTTLLAYLQTVMQGLRSLQIEEQAKEIQTRVGQLGQHIARYEEYMQKLGGSLGTTVNHFNAAHREFAKVDKDVVRITGGNPSIEPLQIDKPQSD
ncbi:DNA recombination protein RmuC [Candidatus Saccharibacteria bacterium]|nr:DNA recombination protein RmuC [Candidatus Saccharibacteria bacterium]MCL1962940.1 DNA recombination protein RmuC [Candidatus Saccharibacteria bacterium]